MHTTIRPPPPSGGKKNKQGRQVVKVMSSRHAPISLLPTSTSRLWSRQGNHNDEFSAVGSGFH